MRSSHHWVTGWLSPQGCRLTAQHSTRTFRSPCRARGRRRCRTTPQCFEPRRACAQFLILMREDLHCRSSLRGPAMCVWVGECWRTCAYVRTPPTRRASCACAPLRPNSSLHEQCDGARTPPLPPPPIRSLATRVCEYTWVCFRVCVHVGTRFQPLRSRSHPGRRGRTHGGPRDRDNVEHTTRSCDKCE